MKKLLVCTMILGFSLITCTTSFAQADPAKAQRGILSRQCISKWEMFMFMRNLDITKEQVLAFKDLAESVDNATATIAADIKELEDRMTDTFLAAAIDTGEAETQIEEMLALQNNLADILLHARLEAVQILTGEQRTMILDMINKLRECAAGHVWKILKKPAYFSLIMPEQAL